MHKLIVVLGAAFLGFILWVIYRADLGQPTDFHIWVMTIAYGDKIGHFIIYGLLAIFSNLALKLHRVKLGGLSIYAGGLFVFAFAVVEEASQLLFPQRTLDIVDLLSGTLGIIVFGAFSRHIALSIKLSFQEYP